MAGSLMFPITIVTVKSFRIFADDRQRRTCIYAKTFPVRDESSGVFTKYLKCGPKLKKVKVQLGIRFPFWYRQTP